MYVTTAASAANLAAQDRFATRVAEAAGGLEGRTIGLLGLAFKAGTDDIRDSPAVRLAERLIGGGATVRGYDPAAGPNAAARVAGLDVVDDPRRRPWSAPTSWSSPRNGPSLPRPAVARLGRRRASDRSSSTGGGCSTRDALRDAGFQVVQLGDGRERSRRPLSAGTLADA